MNLTTRSGSRFVRRVLLVALAGIAGAVAVAAPAAAHVTVNPKQADPGSYTRVAFRVPTESDTASTTKVQVYLPVDNPVASVSVMPVPGWTVTVAHRKPAKPMSDDDGAITEVVSTITWTANKGAAIRNGEFQEFPVSLGPLPKSGSLTFKALQTYSDGSVVRWIDQASGGAEAKHPAPTLTIGATAGAPGGAGGTTATAARKASAADTGSGTGSGSALVVAIIGLVAGVAGLGLGGLALSRTRRGNS